MILVYLGNLDFSKRSGFEPVLCPGLGRCLAILRTGRHSANMSDSEWNSMSNEEGGAQLSGGNSVLDYNKHTGVRCSNTTSHFYGAPSS